MFCDSPLLCSFFSSFSHTVHWVFVWHTARCGWQADVLVLLDLFPVLRWGVCYPTVASLACSYTVNIHHTRPSNCREALVSNAHLQLGVSYWHTSLTLTWCVCVMCSARIPMLLTAVMVLSSPSGLLSPSISHVDRSFEFGSFQVFIANHIYTYRTCSYTSYALAMVYLL